MAPIITNGLFNAITAWTPIAVTAESDTDVFAAVAHGLLDGQKVYLYGLEGGTGIDEGFYYVINKNADDFQLSLTRGGAAVTFTTDITAGYVVRYGDGLGVPTGWTITQAGSSEFVAGKFSELAPFWAPRYYGLMKVDATPAACSAHEHITLAPNTRYHLKLGSVWDHEDPAEVSPAHHAHLSLVEDGNGHSLLSTGLWQDDQNAVIDIPVTPAEGAGLSIVFTTPATHTAYTLTIDKGTLQGTAGYCEKLYIIDIKIEPSAENDPKQRPENNDSVRAALPENS